MLIHPVLPPDEAFYPGFWCPGAPVHLTGYRFEDFDPFFQIEGKLPEQVVDGIFHDLRETGPAAVIVQAAGSEVLLHDVPVFGYGLVA